MILESCSYIYFSVGDTSSRYSIRNYTKERGAIDFAQISASPDTI